MKISHGIKLSFLIMILATLYLGCGIDPNSQNNSNISENENSNNQNNENSIENNESTNNDSNELNNSNTNNYDNQQNNNTENNSNVEENNNSSENTEKNNDTNSENASNNILYNESNNTITEPLSEFSFFVTSLASLQELSGSQDGFGGDLRFGETGAGAGLMGADKICETIAEKSMPGSSVKQWKAFLSVSSDENGNQVNAIDRIGEGPWYDRMGRLLAPNLNDLIQERPQNGDASIKQDLPNEFGIPNKQPDPTQDPVDNHHMLTGSDANGILYSSTATCQDWTSSDGSSANGEPRCGLSWPRNMGGGGWATEFLPNPPPGMGDMSSTHWISAFSAPGCAPGVEITQSGRPSPGSDFVGAGGGYGGFYCFALTP